MSDSDSPQLPEVPRVQRLAWYAVIGLFIFAAVAVMSEAKEFFVPVLLAFLLSMVFAPLRRVFDRRGVPTAVSAIGIVMALVFLIAGLVSALTVPASNWVSAAPRIEHQVQQRIIQVSHSLSGLIEISEHKSSGASKTPAKTDADASNVATSNAMATGKAVATSALLVAPSILAQLVFTFVLLLFLLASGDMFYEKLVHALPTFSDKRRAMRIVFAIERKLSRYLMTIALINAGVGMLVGIAMTVLRVPDAALIGLVAFLFNFVPYIGAFCGIVLVGGIAIVNFSWIGWAAIASGSYLLITVIEGQLVTPYFVGRNLRLNTVVVFVAVSFWAWLWSVIGMIVAVPLLVALRTFCEHIDGLQNLGDFLSERHAERELPAEDEAPAARSRNQS